MYHDEALGLQDLMAAVPQQGVFNHLTLGD